MKYYSTADRNYKVDLKEAVTRSLAPGRGLYMPEVIPALPEPFLDEMDDLSFEELSTILAGLFFEEDLPEGTLEPLVKQALNFPVPLVEIEEGIYSLELFHGPTMAFKDVGARFMARMLSALTPDVNGEVHVLVATSGDTGGAVANGFYKVEGITVHVLYPKGLVSEIQEKQFTTLGSNIHAIEIGGTFDDCQNLVKQAFTDPDLNTGLYLTSANSINLARLLPQSFYYFNAFRQRKNKNKKLVFSVPSGNFGNLTAGLIAWKMGLPVDHFIASTNINDVIPQYLLKGVFTPRPSLATIANAMDVGNPSNFVRMLEIFGNSHKDMSLMISGYSYKDSEIREGIAKCLDKTGYLSDPHGATAYLAGLEYRNDHQESEIIFLETAHPAKFRESVEEVTQMEIDLPEQLRQYLKKEKKSTALKNDYAEFKNYLSQFKD